MGEGKERIGFVEGTGEPVLELSVRAICHGLKVGKINNSSIICLLLISN